MKKLLFLFIFFLPTFLFSQSLREFDLQEMGEQQIPVFIDHPNEAVLIFYTAINGFTVQSSTGGIVKIESETSKVTVFVKPERQILTLKAPGFFEQKLAMESLSAKEAKFYKLNQIEVAYSPEKGSFLINTDPEGCMLKIDGMPSFKQFTPFELYDYEAKKYRISLVKPDYFPIDTLIEIRRGLKQSKMYKLRVMFGIISLKAPAPVKVKINDLELDAGTEFINQKLREGEYLLTVNDFRFDPYQEAFRIQAGEMKVDELPLVKRVGFLKFNHADAFGFTVNGKAMDKKPGMQVIEFFEGNYELQIKRSGFQPVSFAFSIIKGAIVSFEPVFKSVLIPITITTQPEGATVTLFRNGEPQVLGFTPLKDELTVGKVEFLVRNPGYHDFKFSAEIEEGTPFTRSIDLQEIKSKLSTAEVEKSKTVIYPTGQLFDICGNFYQTVVIGDQEWTVENLRTTKFNDGTEIQKITDGNEWKNDRTGAYCTYNNRGEFADSVGLLYNYFAVETGELAPKIGGWRVPTEADWEKLILAAGGDSAALNLKSRLGWPGKGNGTNNFGFSGLPGGWRSSNSFFHYGKTGNWWTATESNSEMSKVLIMDYRFSAVEKDSYPKFNGFSIRLVRDR